MHYTKENFQIKKRETALSNLRFAQYWITDKQMYHGRSYAYAPDDVDGCIYLKKVKNPKIGKIVKVKIIDALVYDLIGEVVEE